VQTFTDGATEREGGADEGSMTVVEAQGGVGHAHAAEGGDGQVEAGQVEQLAGEGMHGVGG